MNYGTFLSLFFYKEYFSAFSARTVNLHCFIIKRNLQILFSHCSKGQLKCWSLGKTAENVDYFESGSDLLAPVQVNNDERAATLNIAVSELCKNVAQEDFLIAAFVLGDLYT